MSHWRRRVELERIDRAGNAVMWGCVGGIFVLLPVLMILVFA
jgi:hypothetical protein